MEFLKHLDNRTKVIIGVYLFAVLMQIIFIVPYTEYEVRITDKNVPHKYEISSGYNNIIEITKYISYQASHKDGNNKETIRRRKVDNSRLAFQLFLTTVVAFGIFAITTPKKSADAKRAKHFKDVQTDTYIKTIARLSKENKELRTLIQRSEMYKTIYSIPEEPVLRVNKELSMFEDNQITQEKIDKFKHDVEIYTMQKIFLELRNANK